MYKFLILIIFNIVLSQTTGKISGVIKDNATNQPIIGANVIIIGAGIGAATDLEGNYFIINIDPGTYSLRVDYIGYESVIIKNVNVSVNRTSAQDILMKQSFVTGAVVEVTGNPVDIKKDIYSYDYKIKKSKCKTIQITHNDVINIGNELITSLHTPGHYYDSICLK